MVSWAVSVWLGEMGWLGLVGLVGFSELNFGFGI